ncbi:MAG: HAMP domain-containing histidine kinase [Reichenbachiella sp.]
MPNALKRIIAVFVVIGLLPIGYVAYELSSINDTEKVLLEVYQRQLDAILFSVNQYSSDIVSSWANQLNFTLKEDQRDGVIEDASINQLFSQVQSLQSVYLWHHSGESSLWHKSDSSSRSKTEFENILVRNEGVLKKVIHYKKSGYQKMEVLDSSTFLNQLPILFALDTSIFKFDVCLLMIDPVLLIESQLGPKMQAIGADKFSLSARRVSDDSLIYNTDNVAQHNPIENDSKGSWQKRSLWLLPNYYLEIFQKGITIDQLIKERSNRNLMVLGLILFISIGGMIFLFMNIKREIYLSNAKSEFVSNVSHEIRTPLSLISMFAETLEMGRVSKEEKKLEYYSIIKKETFRLTKIVNSILSFSKLDANKRTYQFEDLNLNELCKEILLSYSHHLADNKFNYDVHLTESIGLIHGDREAVSETIINLVDNAVKYSDNKKEVVINTGVDKELIYVEVKDFGMGIPKKYHDEIFDQFFRTPSNNVHNTKGSGLGLAIVKRIMTAHNGSVNVKSTPGKGSTFRLNFPTITQI